MAKDTLASLLKEYDEYLYLGNKDRSDRSHFPSGLPALNQAAGDLRGFESGIVQIIGAEAVGKTTIAFDIVAHSQRNGLKDITLPDGKIINTLFIDFERTYDGKYAKALGVDTSKMLVIKTTYAEQAFNIAERLLIEGLQLMIIDSIAMVLPEAESEKDFEDNPKMAAEAHVISRFLKRANIFADDADALILMINQYRSNVSPMARTERKPYGAWMMKHVIKLTLELTRVKREEDRMHIQCFIAKNKQGALGKTIAYEIAHGKGIDIMQNILNLAFDYEIVQKSGAWWYYPNKANAQYKAQGDQNALANFPMEEIKQKVLEAMANE